LIWQTGLFFGRRLERGEGSTPRAGGFVAEAESDNVRGAAEVGVDELTEGARALAMDDADLAPALPAAFFEERVDNIAGLGRAEGVEIERALERLGMGLAVRRAVGHGKDAKFKNEMETGRRWARKRNVEREWKWRNALAGWGRGR
jgi:hypothetical protein